MPEFAPYPTKPLNDWVRGPTQSEMSTWDRLLQQHKAAGDALDLCALLFENAIIAFRFAERHELGMQIIPPTLEQRYLAVKSRFSRLTRAIRGVEDHTLGVRFVDGDVDILAESDESADEHGLGMVPLVIVGVVVIAAAVAVAYWATQEAIDISRQAAELVRKADAEFCADPNSELCQSWKQEKMSTRFAKNETLADTIKSGVVKVGSGIAMGAMLLIGVAMFLGRRK